MENQPENNVVKMGLNPEITELTIGTRNLRKITIYPLSMADQFKVTDLIAGVISEAMVSKELDDTAFAILAITMIKENIGKIIEYATDENGEEILKELSNKDVVAIADILWQVNYESLSKNFKSLVERVKGQFLPTRQSQE